MKTSSVTPLIDIVVLVHDKANWADLCIRAVEHHTKNAYRLIIVDMASKEASTHELLKLAEDRGHTVIRLAENRSFSNGVNAGVSHGSAKFICLLNDDVIVTSGWDTALLQDCTDKFTGLVGTRTNYASGAQSMPEFQGEPPYLTFVCVALRRQVWDAVGPMDEATFDGFSSEDIDYSWRVKKAGYKLKLSSAYVLHAGNQTLAATTGDVEARRLNDRKYNARLTEKWGAEWMKEHTQLLPRVLVMTYHAEEWTRVDFMGDLLQSKGGGKHAFSFYHSMRAPIHFARQVACDYALDSGFDVLVQLDDDAKFPADFLSQLLAHQKPVVTALAYQRKPPHSPCIFSVGDDGLMGSPMEGIEHTGLRKVDISGYHCSALRTSVIKTMRDGIKDADGKVLVPGTRQYFGGFDAKVGEDFAFSLNLKKYGIPLYCDTNLISGHIGSAIVVDEAYKQKYMAGQR